jgi:hypothetical protein
MCGCFGRATCVLPTEVRYVEEDAIFGSNAPSMTVYFRSPSYNAIRLLVSAVVALMFGSVLEREREPIVLQLQTLYYQCVTL